MKTLEQIEDILDELDTCCADDLESQDLDFKQWDTKSTRAAIDRAVQMAVCMANGGGGVVVFGVKDRTVGRSDAIAGVPLDIDVNRLKKAVYDGTDPRLTPVFAELTVPEGTGRLVVMTVYPGMPPYTTSDGAGTIRVGKDCQPLTGTMRARISVETGETDFSATPVEARPESLISPTAMESLRESGQAERAPEELIRRSDQELLQSLGLLRSGKLTRAGLLLCGSEEALISYIPGYTWTYLRMQSDTSYSDRCDGSDAIISGLGRITDRIMADNPIATMEYGLFHFEYRTYPVIALREALLNAFCHADFRLQSPIVVKQFPGKLEISNPGGFLGGISPNNILHHPPIPRNPLLADALTRLRLVNRSNLGISRMYEAMLVEGKEPPLIQEKGNTVVVTFGRQEFSAPFRVFVAEQSRQGHILSVDELLVIQYLLHNAEIHTASAAALCQRDEQEVRRVLSEMEQHHELLDRGGTGRGTYWALRTDLHARIGGSDIGERTRRTNWEAAKTRVLSILTERAQRGDRGLSNSDIRRITRFDRFQVLRLMAQLAEEGLVARIGEKRGARWKASRVGFDGGNDVVS